VSRNESLQETGAAGVDPGGAAFTSSGSATGVEVQRLKGGAVGIAGVIFMAVATAAPITAMVGNVPIAVGSGNGSYAPAGYLVATIVLSLFSLGYSAMAKHITATGAFYGYISHGLGRVVGMASGSVITMAYIVFEASLVGIFSFFAQSTVEKYTGATVPWIVFAAVMLVLNSVLCYFDINLTAKVLGVFLVTEVLILALMAFAVLFHGGGPHGFAPESINPVNAFSPAVGVVGATAGIGLFFAFWSWVGFESTAMYGEESRDPKRVIPRATMLSVIGIGLFYVFVSWMAIAGTGPAEAVALAQDPSKAAEIFFGPTRELVGSWAVDVFNVLLMTGSFACGMAFHNCAARYIYALGREDLLPGFRRTIGRTHAVHGSPHIASFVQTGIATVLVLGFLAFGKDPYSDLYALLAILGTMAILIVQALCAFSVIGYFHVGKHHPETAHWFRTFLAPLLGGVGMLYVVFLLWQNKDFAAGAAAQTLLFKLTPYIVVGVFLLGAGLALYFRARDPRRYEVIGRIVLEDTGERD
jgi:amino acid transporter